MNGTTEIAKLQWMELNHCCEGVARQGTYHRVLTSLGCQIHIKKFRAVTLRNFNEWILLRMHKTPHGAFKPQLLIRTSLLHRSSWTRPFPFYKPKIIGVNNHRTFFSPINSHTCMHTYLLFLMYNLPYLCEPLCNLLLEGSKVARQVLQHLVHFFNLFLPQKYKRSKLKTQVFN